MDTWYFKIYGYQHVRCCASEPGPARSQPHLGRCLADPNAKVAFSADLEMHNGRPYWRVNWTNLAFRDRALHDQLTPEAKRVSRKSYHDVLEYGSPEDGGWLSEEMALCDVTMTYFGLVGDHLQEILSDAVSGGPDQDDQYVNLSDAEVAQPETQSVDDYPW